MSVNDIAKVSMEVLKYTSPLTWVVADTVQKSVTKINEVSNSGSMEELQNIALKQKLEMQIAEAQAKVAQEISIARRIDTAEEVIIEEYYEGAGEGKLGLDVTEGAASLGLSGSGKRISKRVYTFKGWREGGLEGIEKLQGSDKE